MDDIAVASARHSRSGVAGLQSAVIAMGLLMSMPASAFAADIWTLCLNSIPPVEPGQVWQAWSLAPEIVLPLSGFAFLYGVGWLQSRRSTSETPISASEGGFAAAGILLLAIALVSPLCRLSANLAWSHMLQHLVIVALAPPIILLGAPQQALRLALGVQQSPPRRAHKRTLARRDLQRLIAAFAYGAAIWFWHIPMFYEAALASASVHLLYVASLLIVSLWFWHEVISAPSEALGITGFIVLVTLIHTGMLGALLTFAQQVWYPAMTPGALLWGMDPLEDQQLAGLIMWIPMGAIYMIAGLLVIGSHLVDEDEPVRRHARPLLRPK